MTFFKIPKDRFFWETIYFHNKFVMGPMTDAEWNKHQLHSTAVELPGLAIDWYMNQPASGTWEFITLSLESRETCPRDDGLVPTYRETFHKHQKLGLSCISLGWWDGIDGGKAFKSLVEICSVCWSVQSVFQWTILYFDENVSKQISCHGTLLFQHLLCWAKTEGEEMQN